MYLTPVPGSDRGDLIKALRGVQADLVNIRARTTVRSDMLLHYSLWAAESVRLLRGRIRDADIDRLVLTRRYWALQAATASTEVGVIVDTEIDERQQAFADAIAGLESEQQVETSRPGRVVVPDTNVFIEHPSKLEDLDFAEVLGLRETPVRLIIPIIVIDELDALKNHRARKHVGWRASYTLGFLDKILDRDGFGTVRPADYSPIESSGIPRGRVTAEISFDPPGHTRLPVNDDEIVDRAWAIQTSVGREITMLTYDTKMRLRARTAGLAVTKLDPPDLGPEPDNT